MLEVRANSKAASAWRRARSVLVPAPGVECVGSLALGGWLVVHAAQLVESTAVVSTFAVPMAMGAFFGTILSGLRTLPPTRPTGDVDWVERIRTVVFFIGALSPLYRLVRGHQTASTWYALLGGAFVMHSLVLLLQLLKGSASSSLEQTASDTGTTRSA